MAMAYYERGDVFLAGVVGFLLALTLVFLPSLVTLLNCSTVVLTKRPAEEAPSPPPSRHAACATLLHRELFRLPVQVFVFAARAAEHFSMYKAFPALFCHVMSRARGFFYAAITSLSSLCSSKRRVFTPRRHNTHANQCKLAHFVRSLGNPHHCSSLFASFKPRPSHDARDVSSNSGSPDLDIKRLKKKNKNRADKARKKARRLTALGDTALKSSICDSDGDSLTSPYAIKR